MNRMKRLRHMKATQKMQWSRVKKNTGKMAMMPFGTSPELSQLSTTIK